ncbi:nitroreductase family protein [Pseudonocardia sp. CA-107938]|uniref:nitroreductase family protein n=1 Tax=Pseudonocardia sp. CA-107938 TaxID=3240021 RepID=UPI003D8A1AC4
MHSDIDLVLTTTRSVRKRMDLDRPVDRDVVEECLDLALQAPSGANRQDWAFVAVDDPAVKAGVSAVYRAAFVDHYGTRSRPSAAGERLPKGVWESAHQLADTMHRVPVLMIPVRHSVPPQERAGQASWWASILPAAWSFMLAARSRGLVTSYTARGCDREQELAEVLGLEYPGTTQAGIIAVGHPDHQVFRAARRRPLAEVLRWNREDCDG